MIVIVCRVALWTLICFVDSRAALPASAEPSRRAPPQPPPIVAPVAVPAPLGQRVQTGDRAPRAPQPRARRRPRQSHRRSILPRRARGREHLAVGPAPGERAGRGGGGGGRGWGGVGGGRSEGGGEAGRVDVEGDGGGG